MRVVICGGGVIGATLAYFLARRGAEALVVERESVACAASGKAGGFLALDWCDGTPLQALARRSFALHAELADTIGLEWGYRQMTTYGGLADGGSAPGGAARGWLSDAVTLNRQLGTPETTAQVRPAAFTIAMMRAAEDHGAELVKGTVTELIGADGGDRVAGVTVDGEMLAADAVVIAMGPWSVLASDWLPLPRIFALKGHSLVFRTDTMLPADALFLDYRESSGSVLAPEIFPRPDGTVWACAISSEEPLPVDPANVGPDPGAFERLKTMCARLSPVLAEAEIVARQACYRPVARDGLPLIGVIPGMAGAFAATGHSVWGILNAPATAEALAELILDGASSTVDLSPFDPARLRPHRRVAS